ncbi:hypothetical protein BYT27DRAFT_7339396 [Phlegmacium glaucopus]|nr:hypothetical protein BYT27DRAFT_7339396 [Phlegmacium glaucopus]
MLSSAETPRPLPPAKARRATMLKLSSTPPPAYNSPFTFPSRRQSRQDLFGSPIEATFRMMGWDNDSAQASSSPSLKEELDWMKEKSREELEELLVTADDLIKEREHVCNLYENAVALRSEHEVSPTRSTSSPDGPPYMLSRTMNYSTSDSALSVIASPHSSLLRKLDRKVNADISLLADQNAELMDKLERLEAGASSADQTGRRELKRLEKEIAFLREAFEKTQAKSEELEEKVHSAAAGEAWRKKQEREAKIRARRLSGHDTNRQESGSQVQSFAPDGSGFGGPSDGFSFFPTATSPNPPYTRQLKESNSDAELELPGLFPHSEHALISQLLVKVQELEEANAQILKQQNETATQLSAVQRDTEHITKAYESWVDPEAVQPLPESDLTALEEKEAPSTSQTVKIRSIGRNADAQSLGREGGFVARGFTLAAKDRKSVMGLFPHDHPLVADSPPNLRSNNLQLPSRPSSPWSEGLQDRLSWSSAESRGHESPGSLSPLHFFSPATQVLHELSPLESRPTLHSELSKELGDSWDMSSDVHHRTSSLYDLSQFSVPATPSPASRAMSRRASDELNFETLKNGGLCASLPIPAGLLRLSVEPPTPVKAGDFGEYARSPRVLRMSETLRSRTDRWMDRRFKEGHQSSRTTSVQFNRTGSTLAEPASMGLPQRLSNAIDTMIEKFDGLSDIDKPKSNAPSPSLPDDNALQLHVASRSRKETLTKKSSLVNLLFEVWLWFQFAIIIFVFIYTMAKRGPKLVLVDAERKRSIAGAR